MTKSEIGADGKSPSNVFTPQIGKPYHLQNSQEKFRGGHGQATQQWSSENNQVFAVPRVEATSYSLNESVTTPIANQRKGFPLPKKTAVETLYENRMHL